FGWLSWTGEQNAPALVRSLTPPGNSSAYINPDNPSDRQVNVGDWVRGLSGVDNSKDVRRALDTLCTMDIVVPIWDKARGTGANTAYRVCGFAKVRLLSYRLACQNRITARFLGYVQCDPTNVPPVAYSLSVTSFVNTPVLISLRGFDQEGSPLTYTVVSQPGNGTLSGTPPNLTYTPALNYVGQDTFTYKVNDGTNDSAPATVSITIKPVLQGLVVDAGPDQLIVLPASATLNGSVNFVLAPGAPAQPAWSAQWSVVSGPGSVTFSNPDSPVTTATFSQSGIYTLRLTASSQSMTASDEVVVIANAPPTVMAGPNQTNTLPGPVTLLGVASDDGLPTNDVLTVTWSLVSGPGSVTFSDADETNTAAYFSDPGLYVLRLTANDGVASASSDVLVLITEPPAPPSQQCDTPVVPVKGYTGLHQSNFVHDIMLVIDTSASTRRLTGFDLNGDGKTDTVFDAEVEACRRLVRMLTNCPYIRLGVVKFARYNTSNAPVGSISTGPPIPAQTRVVQPLTTDFALIEAALNVVAAEGAKGGTHTAAGIDLAIGALTNAAPIAGGSVPNRHIVLLTDGIPTLPVESGWTQERGDRLATLQAAERAAAAGIKVHPVVIDPEEYVERKLTTMPAVQAITGVARELIRINLNNIDQLPQLLAGMGFVGSQKVVVVDRRTGAVWTVTVQPNGWFEAWLPVSFGTNEWEFRFISGGLTSDQITVRRVTFVAYPRGTAIDLTALAAANPPVRELTTLEGPTGRNLDSGGTELSLLAV
ncbi:MAG: Ig-like domain-containing protein, partial [Verrucomicrobiae bacterium]|nr:Ig-like domain-containing protein [Verrucomicrobiae bacterium]